MLVLEDSEGNGTGEANQHGRESYDVTPQPLVASACGLLSFRHRRAWSWRLSEPLKDAVRTVPSLVAVLGTSQSRCEVVVDANRLVELSDFLQIIRLVEEFIHIRDPHVLVAPALPPTSRANAVSLGADLLAAPWACSPTFCHTRASFRNCYRYGKLRRLSACFADKCAPVCPSGAVS